MDFGKTLEEQYAKISAINKLLAKFSKIFSIIFLCFGIFIFLLSLINSDNRLSLMILSLVISVTGFFIGKHIAGKMYGWAWICFCEKHNPAGLAQSLSVATYNSAAEGYFWGGTSGAKAAGFGVFIVFFFLSAFYIWKGTFYTVKYWYLQETEAQLYNQLMQTQTQNQTPIYNPNWF